MSNLNRLRAAVVASAICLTLAAAACAANPVSTLRIAPKPETVRWVAEAQTERWYVVLGAEYRALLKRPRPAKQRIRGVPGTPMVQVTTLAKVPALDPAAVEAAAAAELARIFKHLPMVEIKFLQGPLANPSSELALGERPVNVVMISSERARGGRLFGMADKIDNLNRDDDHVVKLYLSNLIEAIRHDPARMLDPMLSLPNRAPNEAEVGCFMGVLLAHEIGHTLGLRHEKVECEADSMNVMATGSMMKYAVPAMGKAKWSVRNAVYMYHVLNGLKLPEWIKQLARDADKAGADTGCSCSQCSG